MQNKVDRDHLYDTYPHFKRSRYYQNRAKEDDAIASIIADRYEPSGNHSRKWIVFGAIILLVVFSFFYKIDKLGFDSKTFWDLLELLIVPAVLAVGGFLFSNAQRKSDLEVADKERQTDREIAKDRLQQNILDAYFDRITELLLTGNLELQNINSNAYKIAKIRTLVVLRSLDAERNQQVSRFLWESGIFSRQRETSLDFSGVDLENSELGEFDFSGANFQSANLVSASLSKAKLSNVNLSHANLFSADLTGANLNNADLSHANLTYASLSGAKLNGANLRGANLLGAVLSGAEICRADIRDADLRGAIIFETTWETIIIRRPMKIRVFHPAADLRGTKYNKNTKFTFFNQKGFGHVLIHLPPKNNPMNFLD